MNMTEDEAEAALRGILLSLGVSRGDCIMLGIDMGGLPLPAYPSALNRRSLRERERRWCAFVYETLIDCLGPEGTLLMPSYTYSCGRPGSLFVAEETPSENGPFTEYFRGHPGTTRSLHPIFSVSGAGAKAHALLTDCGRSAFGARSPFGRFAEYGVRFVCLGIALRHCITYIHHLEQVYGCPHRYNKPFHPHVIANGRTYTGEWYASVGFRQFNYTSDISSLELELDRRGFLIHADWNGRPNQSAQIADVDLAGYDLLAEDSRAFMDKQYHFVFEEGEVSATKNGLRSALTIDVEEFENRR